MQVNSAGSLQRGGIENLSMEDFDTQMNINVRCVYCIILSQRVIHQSTFRKCIALGSS